MSFQLSQIVLYSYLGDSETVDLNLGKLNIITGDSGTGKSALIDIIDYCLGSKNSKIPAGPIKDKVEWVAIVLKISDGEVFIARKLPVPQKKSSTTIYYNVQNKIEIPKYSELKQNITIKSLRDLLSKYIHINENVQESLNRPLKATIRHSINFTFQKQTELSDNSILFYRQSNNYIAADIKATLPYFLGVVNNDYVVKNSKLKKLRRKLNGLNLRKAENESIKSEGLSKAEELLLEAENLGIYQSEDVLDNWNDYISALKEIQIKSVNIEEGIEAEGKKYEQLQKDHTKISNKIRILGKQVESVKKLDSYSQTYSEETGTHIDRLKSIYLFDKSEKVSSCPLCNSHVSNTQLPEFQDFEKSIEKLNSQIRSVDERSPKMQEAIRILNEKLDNEIQKLKKNEEALIVLEKSYNAIKNIKQLNYRRTYLKGKMDFYLESIDQPKDTTDLAERIKTIESKIQRLESEISTENMEKRIKFALISINKDIIKWAKYLNLEHCSNPISLDLKRLTLQFKTPSGEILFNEIGSAENKVGYHIITNLALQKWFVTENRPVPRFLFIDQPSQPYFSDKKVNIKEDLDHKTVTRIYNLLYDFINELEPNFQVIVTDHANLDYNWFQECVIENWRDGNKLVPIFWVSTNDLLYYSMKYNISIKIYKKN